MPTTNEPEFALLAAIRSGGPLGEMFRTASQSVRVAIEALLSGPRGTSLVSALEQNVRRQQTPGVNNSPLAVLRECRAGCSSCCHTVGVDVTPLEALAVARHLETNTTDEQRSAARARLVDHTAERAAMTPQQRQSTRLRCGLLGDDGLCSVYAARPFVCAGVYSLSRSACEASTESADLAAHTVPLDRPAKAWTMGVSGGLQRALVEAGLDGNLYELNSAVLCALDEPRAAQRWLQGEDVFRAAICTDAHSWPRSGAPRRIPQQRRAAA